MYKHASRNRQPRIAGIGAVPGTAEWMRRQSDRKHKRKISRQVARQVRPLDDEVRGAKAQPFAATGPQLRKQPPREANREGLVAFEAPTVSVPPLAGESQSAQKTTA